MRSNPTLRILPPLAAALLLAGLPAARAYSSDDAAASRRSRDVGVLLRMNFDFGGDKVATVKWSDGSSTDLNAAQLITFAAGALYHPGTGWALEGTVGYKFDQANGSNGSISFTRIPVDVIASWASGRHRLGAGPTVHFAPTLGCHVTGLCSQDYNYDTALGGIAQYAYGFPVGANGGLEAGARFTFIQYRGSGLLTKDGSGAGFFFGGWF